MSNGIIETIKKIGVYTKTKPASESDVLRVEKELGIKLADEYKEYVMEYGAIRICGLELTGVTRGQVRDVAVVTKTEKEYNKNISDDMYVVEELGIDSILILQDSEGMIYINSPIHKTKKIFGSLSEYLLCAASEYKCD